MDFPDDEDILAEEQFMQEYNNFPDDIPFEDEPPSLEDIIKPIKKLTERQVQNVPEKAKETERLSRKRLQDDLFGDLDGLEDSILEEVIENYSDAKRPKVSQPSTVTSAKTADALKNLFGRSSPVKSPSPIDHDSYLDRLEAIISTKNAARKNAKSELPLLRRRKYAFRTLPDVPFLSMTNEKGERMYMLLKDQEQRHISDVKSHKPGTLLGVSISVLKLQLEKEKERKEKEKKEALEKRLESFGNLEFRKRKRHKENKVESGDSSWLESYRPRKYFDLLSHEATNRALLRWLKLWDKVVFNREVKIRPRLQDGSAVAEDQTQRNQYQGGNKFQKKFVTTDESVIQELDDKGKPIQKVALLCGPPGLGKTTLAHVVATHAGYNVVEMNASDDRTVEAFKLQLETATQMKSVVSSDPRPNCLIIDEIDGAPSAAVNFLISHLQAQDGDKQKGKKKKGSPKVLQRPIICICNDLYAPSLRQLRAVALILSFPPTESSRLANRLLEISQEHDIQTDLATLLALCEKAENDIRSCLATLYFFRLQGKSFRLQNVLNSNVGAKDSSKSFFSVWQELFQRQNEGKRSARNMPLQADPSTKKRSEESERYHSVLDSVQSCGDYERLMSGVFENYLNIKFRDNKMDNVSSGLDWMCFYDIINQQISHSQNYSMLAFLPHIFVKLHFLFSGTERPKIIFPKVQTEMNTVKSKNENIVNTITTEMAPSMLIYLTPRVLILDVLPYTMECLTPNFRPVSTQLYSLEERQEALRVVTTMISLNLTYRQERTLDGQYAYVLDPNIEELIYFDNTKQRRQLSYASKQFIAREIELEKMRRLAGSEAPSKAVPDIEKAMEELTEQPKAVPNHLQTLKAKTVSAIVSKPARDFFGRIINKTDKDQPSDGKSSGPKDLLRGDIWYHFKEGYSNAVRRKVRVKDFM